MKNKAESLAGGIFKIVSLIFLNFIIHWRENTDLEEQKCLNCLHSNLFLAIHSPFLYYSVGPSEEKGVFQSWMLVKVAEFRTYCFSHQENGVQGQEYQESKTKNNRKQLERWFRARFLNCAIYILVQVILCCGGLFCALLDVQSTPGLISYYTLNDSPKCYQILLNVLRWGILPLVESHCDLDGNSSREKKMRQLIILSKRSSQNRHNFKRFNNTKEIPV